MCKVSIIVPVFNNEKYLDSCLQSLIRQTNSNIEILIINDGSTDNSYKIAKEFANKDDRIKLYNIANSGVSVARNVGINEATGNYITFVDSDDWIEPETIELALENIIAANAQIAIWSFFKNYEQKEIKLSLIPGKSREFKNDFEKEILYLKSIYAHYNRITLNEDVPVGTAMCKLYKLDFIKENNLEFNPNLIRSEDAIFSINAFQLTNKIVYFDKSLYHYRINSNSMSFGFKYIHDTKTPFNLLIDELEKFKSKVPNKDLLQDVIYCRVIQIIYWHFSYNYFNKENKTNILRKRIAMKKILNDRKYVEALMNVKKSYLPRQSKIMVFLFQKHMILSFYLFQKLIKFKKKFLNFINYVRRR